MPTTLPVSRPRAGIGDLPTLAVQSLVVTLSLVYMGKTLEEQQHETSEIRTLVRYATSTSLR